MIIEISIAKEKLGKMPKGSTEALKLEMTLRVSQQPPALAYDAAAASWY